MSTKRLSAEITNRITDLDEGIYHQNGRGRGIFRVTVIRETYEMNENGDHYYSVSIFGRVQTANGQDHARNKGEFSWRDTGSWASQTPQIPAEIRKYLAGRDELARVVLI